MEFGMAYHRANEILDREIKLLFQRFNIFLIGTGILFAAYATVVINNELSVSIYSRNIPTLAASLGLGLSIFTGSINYLNSRIIVKISNYVSLLEGIPGTIQSVDNEESITQNNICLIEDTAILPQNQISNITQTMVSKGNLLRIIPPFFIAELLGNIYLKIKDPRVPLITTSQYAFFLPFLLANVWLGVLGNITSIWGVFICFLLEAVSLLIFFVIVIVLKFLPSDAFSHPKRNIPLP